MATTDVIFPTTATRVPVGAVIYVVKTDGKIAPAHEVSPATPKVTIKNNVKGHPGKRFIATSEGDFEVAAGKHLLWVKPDTSRDCPQGGLHARPGICACGVVTEATTEPQPASAWRKLNVAEAAEVEAAVVAAEPVEFTEAVVMSGGEVTVVERAAESPVEASEPVVAPAGTVTVEKGLRVHHSERIVGGCTGDEHRNGVMSGRGRVTQGRDHAEVVLDCGHTRWPLLRVLREGRSA